MRQIDALAVETTPPCEVCLAGAIPAPLTLSEGSGDKQCHPSSLCGVTSLIKADFPSHAPELESSWQSHRAKQAYVHLVGRKYASAPLSLVSLMYVLHFGPYFAVV